MDNQNLTRTSTDFSDCGVDDLSSMGITVKQEPTDRDDNTAKDLRCREKLNLYKRNSAVQGKDTFDLPTEKQDDSRWHESGSIGRAFNHNKAEICETTPENVKVENRNGAGTPDLEYVDVASLNADRYGGDETVSFNSQLTCDPLGNNAPSTSRAKPVCSLCDTVLANGWLLGNHILSHYGIVRCEVCGTTFQDRSELDKHFETHETGPRSCPTCWKVFETRGAYRNHIKNYCAVIYCSKCNVTFSNKIKLRNHSCVEVNLFGPFICTMGKCTYAFKTRQQFSDHTFAHYTIYRCGTCSTILSNILDLETHLLTHDTSECETPQGSHVFTVDEPITNRLPPPVSSIRCGNCDQSFENQLLLDKHLETNGKGSWTFLPCGTDANNKNTSHVQTPCGMFRCGICNKTYLEKRQFRLHIGRHSNTGKTFSCPMCGKTFTTGASQKSHVMYAKCKRLLKCDFCEEKFRTVDLLREHRKKEHERLKCPLCNKSLSSGYLIETHIRNIHFGVRPYLCDQCGKTYPTQWNLRKHKEVHAGKKAFKCATCDKEFWYRVNLLKHIRTHTSERPFRCDLCPATFLAHKSLMNHINDHSRPDVTCAICNKAFSKIVYLNKHTRRFHKSEDSYRCATCGQLFQSKKMLVEHLQNQNCEKHLLCRICEKPFQSKATLRKHLKAHAVSVRCSWCHKSFESNAHLKRHELLHSENMPFQCSVCGKQYAQAGNFKYHMRTSHGITLPFTCEVCSEAFALPSLLKQHGLFHVLETVSLASNTSTTTNTGQLQLSVGTKWHSDKLDSSSISLPTELVE